MSPSRWRALAVLAALCLLLFTALDWWSTDAGEDARRTEGLAQPQPDEGAEQQQFDKDVQSEASVQAEGAERNAWQPDGALDLIVLLLVLAAAAAGVAAAALVSARRRAPPLATLATALSMLAAVAIVIDVLRTGVEPGAQIEAGVPLSLLALGALALGCSRAASFAPAHEQEPAPDGAHTGAAPR